MHDPPKDLDALLDKLTVLYGSIAQVTQDLDRIHADRLTCRLGCTSCCVDDISVFEIEAEHIRRRFGNLLADGEPGPEGACAFLGAAGECRIYEARPYVCRTQGYPLRWLEELGEAGIFEMRDICPLNDTDEPIEELAESHCWSIGPIEAELAALQHQLDNGSLRRVILRSLFERTIGTNPLR